ncbi:carbohydrate sulfotransferase 12 [Protopterus annectens]|uniref:carbohydrate sulfotransferase 12 n=1 Tax=Protopterus annectens TaxID=7888 RepID=UPI001CFBA7DA|nr:carbohydrate sulfotransferase 12 [Protopterus annectens]
MTKLKMFRFFLILGSLFMILLIIFYWDDVGAAQLYFHSVSSKQQSLSHFASLSAAEQTFHGSNIKTFMSGVDEFTDKIFSKVLVQNQTVNKNDNQRTPQLSNKQASGQLEEIIRGYDWATRSTRINMDYMKLQNERKQMLHSLCRNSTLQFSGKNRSFEDIPNKELDHLIVDDRHGIIYCYVPKVACTNWKRILIVLSQSVQNNGKPYSNPLDIPRENVHNTSSHFTFNKFWKRYGKFSKHLMKIKLKKYTKFLFTRDPFVRLISAFRSKFELENEGFYKEFGMQILKLYSNVTEPPASVSEAFATGNKPSFNAFVQYLLDPETERRVPFNEHWRQVYRLCHPCQINYDFIGKLETLTEDAEYLLQLLNLENKVQFPPSYRNRTASSWEEDWFAKIPIEWRRKLYRLYEPDFLLFGYPKPESLLQD